MQYLLKSQLRHRSKFSQLILLNDQALIVSSCDSIFNTQLFKNNPVTNWFPFIESIFSTIWPIINSQSNITFNKIQTPIPELPGLYDFTFSKKVIDNSEFILWSIYDFSDLYEDLKQFQQRKNELEIHRETLERRHKAINQADDIKIQQNIIIESLDHLQLTYFNKIKSALLAPVNALDGITFLLAGTLENKNSKYTQQLRIVLKQLNLILDELDKVNFNQAPDFSKEVFSLTDLQKETESFISHKNSPVSIIFSFSEDIPKTISGNYLYLKQIITGVLANAIDLHPDSTFEIKVSKENQIGKNLSLSFTITEYLNSKTKFLSESNYVNMIYTLSIIKQLIDLQKGNIYVDKNPKDLSISIRFDLTFNL
jgi:signal transduction histidine kinase